MNRIPGMALALRKASLDAALAACRLLHPRGFNFRPRCWSLPAQGYALVAWAQARPRDASWLIVKPDGGSEGRGIVLLAAADLDHAAVRDITEREGVCVAEEYIADPMLVEGFKFDLRGKFVMPRVCCQLCIAFLLWFSLWRIIMNTCVVNAFAHYGQYSLRRPHSLHFDRIIGSFGSLRLP